MLRHAGSPLTQRLLAASSSTSSSSLLLRPLFPGPFARHYATQKKKKKEVADISQIPIKMLSVMADFYIPPRLSTCPIKSWPRLIARRLGVFVVNTYSVVKFKRETNSTLQFNKWKDQAIDMFVKTNKVFAAGCSKRPQLRESYIRGQLEDVAGVDAIAALSLRAKTFPADALLDWELVSIVGNPKVVSFNSLPDAYDNTAYVQFVMKLQSKQRLTITQNGEPKVNERTVTDYLVYTFNPWSDQMVLVGTLFELDHLRGVSPSDNFTNPKFMIAFGKNSADIYRENPRLSSLQTKD